MVTMIMRRCWIGRALVGEGLRLPPSPQVLLAVPAAQNTAGPTLQALPV